MTCDQCQAELTAFQLGVVDDATRDALERHLPECADCVRSFLRLKRAVETAELEPAPSGAVRARLRAAVAAELSPPPAERSWRWWERPLAFALAGASVMAALAFVHNLSLLPGFPPVAP